MLTLDRAAERRYAAGPSPVFFYWPQSKSKPAHCSWLLHHVYLSPMPDGSSAADITGSFPLKKRTLADDMLGIHHAPLRLDMAAMAEEARAMLASPIRCTTLPIYSLSAVPPLNAATIAMLLLVAGMTPAPQREFREKFFFDPVRYSWRSGRSPFGGRLFSAPDHVFHYCLAFKAERLTK
jgi:hypothetical protein